MHRNPHTVPNHISDYTESTLFNVRLYRYRNITYSITHLCLLNAQMKSLLRYDEKGFHFGRGITDSNRKCVISDVTPIPDNNVQ